MLKDELDTAARHDAQPMDADIWTKNQ